jgi:hypothetical protein
MSGWTRPAARRTRLFTVRLDESVGASLCHVRHPAVVRSVAPTLPPEASVSGLARHVLALDDEQERGSRLPRLDETNGLRHAARPAAHCSVGRDPAASSPATTLAPALLLRAKREALSMAWVGGQRRGDALTGIIGARRA